MQRAKLQYLERCLKLTALGSDLGQRLFSKLLSRSTTCGRAINLTSSLLLILALLLRRSILIVSILITTSTASTAVALLWAGVAVDWFGDRSSIHHCSLSRWNEWSSSRSAILLVVFLAIFLTTGRSRRWGFETRSDVKRLVNDRWDRLDFRAEFLFDSVQIESIFVGDKVDSETEMTESS